MLNSRSLVLLVLALALLSAPGFRGSARGPVRAVTITHVPSSAAESPRVRRPSGEVVVVPGEKLRHFPTLARILGESARFPGVGMPVAAESQAFAELQRLELLREQPFILRVTEAARSTVTMFAVAPQGEEEPLIRGSAAGILMLGGLVLLFAFACSLAMTTDEPRPRPAGRERRLRPAAQLQWVGWAALAWLPCCVYLFFTVPGSGWMSSFADLGTLLIVGFFGGLSALNLVQLRRARAFSVITSPEGINILSHAREMQLEWREVKSMMRRRKGPMTRALFGRPFELFRGGYALALSTDQGSVEIPDAIDDFEGLEQEIDGHLKAGRTTEAADQNGPR